MSIKRTLLLIGASFSWFMVLLSWRFDYGLIIIGDWAIFATGLSVWYGYLIYKDKNRKRVDKELLR